MHVKGNCWLLGVKDSQSLMNLKKIPATFQHIMDVNHVPYDMTLFFFDKTYDMTQFELYFNEIYFESFKDYS